MVFGFITTIFGLLQEVVLSSGYLGVFVLMAMESALLPIPSEVVMPFAGYLVSQGKFDLWYITIISTVANLVGSVITYFIGLYLGRSFVLKYGKYILLREKHLIHVENWFKTHGDKAIFFGRLLPGIRTVISLPAGVGKMNFKKFFAYTFIGSAPWNFALTYSGFWFGNNWSSISGYVSFLNYAVIVVIISAIVWYAIHWKNNRKYAG